VAQVMLVLDAMRAKEEQLSSQRAVLSTLTGLEDGVQAQLRNLEAENRSLRAELERLDTQNNNLQGYSLDYMSNDELRELVDSLTQAVERVRITVQLRRLASKKGGAQPALNLSMDGGSAGGMTREAMRRALEDLQVRVGVCMWCVFCGGCQTGWEGGPGRRRALPGQPGGRFAACGRQALTLSSLPSAPTFGTVQSNGHSRRATAVSEASSGDRYRLDEREL
jgi:cell division protein FtsB